MIGLTNVPRRVMSFSDDFFHRTLIILEIRRLHGRRHFHRPLRLVCLDHLYRRGRMSYLSRQFRCMPELSPAQRAHYRSLFKESDCQTEEDTDEWSQEREPVEIEEKPDGCCAEEESDEVYCVFREELERAFPGMKFDPNKRHSV